MRHLVTFTFPLLAACINTATASQEDCQADANTLQSVDLDSMPRPVDGSSASRWVLAGYLMLRPDVYYILSERSSLWRCLMDAAARRRR
jgi:hypothetical protein